MNEPVLTQDQLNGIAVDFGAIIFELIKGFEGLDGSLDLTDTSVNFNQPYSCPISGSVVITGAAQVAYSLGIGTFSGSLVGSSGSITFSTCKMALPNGEILTLNGTLTLSNLSGTASGTYSLGGASATANSTSNWLGNLQVTVGVFNKSCAFNGNHTVNATASIDSSYNVTGSAAGQLTGSICGQNISSPFSANL